MGFRSRLRQWATEWLDDETRDLRWAVAMGIALLLVVYSISISVRFLINDDYQTLYTAWLKAQGKVAGRDYFLTSYYLLVDLIAPLFKVFKNTLFPLYAMRTVFLLLLLLVSWLVMRVTRRLFDATAGFLAPIGLLATTVMLQRGLDLRPDLITNLLWLVILLLLLESKAFPRHRFLLMGALLALATLNRFKGLLILPMMAGYFGWLLFLEPADRMRTALKALADLSLGAVLVLLPYLAWVALTDGLGEFVRVTFFLFKDLSHLPGSPRSVLWETLSESFLLDTFFWALTAYGLFLRMRRWASHQAQSNVLVLGLLGTALLTVWANPAYYAYNLMTLQTLLVPFAAFGLADPIQRIRRAPLARPIALSLISLIALSPLILNGGALLDAVRDSNRHQKNLHRFIQTYVPPEGKVFGLEGIGLFRESVYHWRFPAVLAARYQRGDWSYAQEFRAGAPELVLMSYRVPGWLLPADIRYISDRYTQLTPLIYVPGHDSYGRGPSCDFELVVDGVYEILSLGKGPNKLDGETIEGHPLKWLKKGNHRMEVGEGRILLRRFYPPQAHALVSNPEGLPYLAAPSLRLPNRTVRPGGR